MNDQIQNLRHERLHDFSDTPEWSNKEFCRRKIRKLRCSVYAYAGMAIVFGAFGTFNNIERYFYLIGTVGMIFGILTSEWRIRRLERFLFEEQAVEPEKRFQKTRVQQIDDGNSVKPSGDERTP